MKSKKIIKILKKEAEKLPVEYYYAIEKFFKPLKNPETEQWETGMVVKRERNLGRAVKKVYKNWGLDAVQAWFYVMKNKTRSESEKIIDKEV